MCLAEELAGTQGVADLLAASAAGANRGMPEDLPTSQMSDPKGNRRQERTEFAAGLVTAA